MATYLDTGLGFPDLNEPDYQILVDANFTLLNAMKPLRGGLVAAAEQPSTTLNVNVLAFKYELPDGTLGTYAGGSIFLSGTTTNYVYLDGLASYALTANTIGFPPTLRIELATVLTTTKVQTITDVRTTLRALGTPRSITMGVGANFVLDTATGSKLGTASTQKLGFWNATPIVQPSGANQAALTDSTGGTASFTLAAITAGTTYAQADLTAIKNGLASLARLVNTLRQALVDAGLIKGSA